MTAPKSNYLPEIAGGMVDVTGIAPVDTGIRSVQGFSVTLAQPSTAGAAQATGYLEDTLPGQTQRLIVQVWEDDLVTQSLTPARVSWTVIGQ